MVDERRLLMAAFPTWFNPNVLVLYHRRILSLRTLPCCHNQASHQKGVEQECFNESLSTVISLLVPHIIVPRRQKLWEELFDPFTMSLSSGIQEDGKWKVTYRKILYKEIDSGCSECTNHPAMSFPYPIAFVRFQGNYNTKTDLGLILWLHGIYANDVRWVPRRGCGEHCHRLTKSMWLLLRDCPRAVSNYLYSLQKHYQCRSQNPIRCLLRRLQCSH